MYRFFIATFLFVASCFTASHSYEKETKLVDDIATFNIFLFDGYLLMPNHYFIHGLVGSRLELSSFDTGASAKIYYEKSDHVLKSVELMGLRNIYKSTKYGFNHVYGESKDFGNVVYLYSDKEAFYASGVDRAFYNSLISDFKVRANSGIK